MASNLIKSLQVSLPRGRPIDTGTLREYGISSSLAHEYVKSGWLERLGRGVFLFAGDRLDRDASLRYLETKIPGLHVASKTALDWRGYRQNAAYRENLILWGSGNRRLPDWFLSRFPSRYSESRLFGDDAETDAGLSPMPESPGGPTVSEPERALLEMLNEVGVHQEIEEARNIMESVRQIRFRVLADLLARCRTVKTVLLCAVWAGELGLPWARKAKETALGITGEHRWVMQLPGEKSLTLTLKKDE